jgi:hypothetical protein
MALNPIRKPPVVAPSRDFFLEMALLAWLLMIISSTCQAFGVPFASRCRAPAAAATFAGSSIVIMKEQKDVLELEGTVLEAMPNANFRVQLDDTEQVRTLL